jgi:glycosyltransferase involved in cell wall biosynthesis
VTRFSIVTVCLNDAEGLVSTLRSVVRQTFSDFQFVVQDGGSTDATNDIVHDFGDWIEIYRSEPDSGIFQAMNRGLSLCTGDYTIFMNAGDMFESVETLAEVAPQIAPEDDLVAGLAIATETGRVHSYNPPNLFWRGSTFDHQATFARTSILQKFGFDESLRITGDLDLFSRLRLDGIQVRRIPTVVCRKPFEQGASSSFMARFPERYSVLMRHFGDMYPVDAALAGDLARYLAQTYGLVESEWGMEAMDVRSLLTLRETLERLSR